ncbi:hypothetical protein COLO4_31380 [Corchorus olitorius]|uniref:Uncharacterized protein n=1 Tax=Corchorus olitorius TaxID=93759 RepID=A0A1R3H4H7_9ROSI|nr:hypothetical protein COLO4_31380 [Corchorus olitorius]
MSNQDRGPREWLVGKAKEEVNKVCEAGNDPFGVPRCYLSADPRADLCRNGLFSEKLRKRSRQVSDIRCDYYPLAHSGAGDLLRSVMEAIPGFLVCEKSNLSPVGSTLTALMTVSASWCGIWELFFRNGKKWLQFKKTGKDEMASKRKRSPEYSTRSPSEGTGIALRERYESMLPGTFLSRLDCWEVVSRTFQECIRMPFYGLVFHGERTGLDTLVVLNRESRFQRGCSVNGDYFGRDAVMTAGPPSLTATPYCGSD